MPNILRYKNDSNNNLRTKSEKDLTDMYPNLYKYLNKEDWNELVEEYQAELEKRDNFLQTLTTMSARAKYNEVIYQYG
ncbi:hypothetical protein ACI2JA_03835 [Alkalihalobacillus sp. NPDC078783]